MRSARRASIRLSSLSPRAIRWKRKRGRSPKPPLPSVNRARGRIGFDYIGTSSSGITTSNLGIVVRADITRLNGTYWNISGYSRGRLQATSPAGQQTIQDLIKPHSTPEHDIRQSDLELGRRFRAAVFALGAESGNARRRIFWQAHWKRRDCRNIRRLTTDPASYSYNPDQEIGGAFINFDGGSYDNWKYTSTSGVEISALNFSINRPFVFFENGVFYKRYLSIYDSLQADSPKGNITIASPGRALAGIS